MPDVTLGGASDVRNWQRGARQIRSAFDDFLSANPSWENGLRQLQSANPGWARGAEQIGAFLTGTPQRRTPGDQQAIRTGKRSASRVEQDRRASALARANRDRTRQQEQGTGEEEYTPLSIAEALARAMQMIGGGGGVNYDPQRQALRERAGEADSRLEAMYRQLQGSYAADAPVIDEFYTDATEGVNTATNQGVSNINAAYDKARADQTAQLAALGIGDAAAVIQNAGQDAGADQAAAVSNLEQNRGANVNQLASDRSAAGAYNKRIGQAAGLEGNLQRATNQSRLSQLLAEIDAQEQQENAALSQSRQSAAMGLASQLVDNDWRERTYRDSRSDAEFERQAAAAEMALQAQKLQGETAARFDPNFVNQQVMSYFEQRGITDPTTEEYVKVLSEMRKLYGG
ncbi:MAG TPA: hypothetical protein VGK43_02030 [Solirubrobacterales bacterium]